MTSEGLPDLRHEPHPARSRPPSARRFANPGFGKLHRPHGHGALDRGAAGTAPRSAREPLQPRSGRGGAALRAGDLRGDEGLPLSDGGIGLFRAEDNARRLQPLGRAHGHAGDARGVFLAAVRKLLAEAATGSRPGRGQPLPAALHVRLRGLPRRSAGQGVHVPGHLQPGGRLLQGRPEASRSGSPRITPAPRPAAPARPSAAATTPPASCRRPRRSSTAATRSSSSTPQARRVEELGGMNVFFVYEDGRPRHPAAPARSCPASPATRSVTLAREEGWEVREERLCSPVARGRRAGPMLRLRHRRGGHPDRHRQGPRGRFPGQRRRGRQVHDATAPDTLDPQHGRAEDTHGWTTKVA